MIEVQDDGTELSEADKKVREVYVENREDMTIRGLRDLVIDVFDEVEDRSLDTETDHDV
ncbi:hypothetical protein [Natrinema sp. CBA1119]|uniref:hypothetical protein n=1 Tax=Natrinema sp. CBA1119 TaxID=1608465 RepID=UPI00159BE6ED|nr:hypothetical protein [Natrinema sp. CBA1119]